MDVSVEQHYVVKFCVFKKKKSTEETIFFLQQAFENEVLGLSMVKRWHKMFLDIVPYMVYEEVYGKTL